MPQTLMCEAVDLPWIIITLMYWFNIIIAMITIDDIHYYPTNIIWSSLPFCLLIIFSNLFVKSEANFEIIQMIIEMTMMMMQILVGNIFVCCKLNRHVFDLAMGRHFKCKQLSATTLTRWSLLISCATFPKRLAVFERFLATFSI